MRPFTAGTGRITHVGSQAIEVLDRGSRAGARRGDPKVLDVIIAVKWLPGTRRLRPVVSVADLFSPVLGEVRRHIGELVAAHTPVFFLRDDKRGNATMQAAREPCCDWDPARAAHLRSVPDAEKPLEIVWEYEWFHVVPDLETGGRLIQAFRAGVGRRVARTRLLSSDGEFGRLVVEEVEKPEGPLSVDHYLDTKPLTWGAYDAAVSAAAPHAWAERKCQARAGGWSEPPADRLMGGYNLIHGSTIRQRHFGDLSQRWHSGAMNIEPFYRRPVPGLGERLEYNFYLHRDGRQTLDADLKIAAGREHLELQSTSGFYLALEQMPGLQLDELRPRVQIAKTRRKFVLREPATGDIAIIVNIDRIDAVDLQERVRGTATYYDVDVSAEGDVLKEAVLQFQQRFVSALRRTWGLVPNDETRQLRAEMQLRALAEEQGRRITRFFQPQRRPPRLKDEDENVVTRAQAALAGGRGRRAPASASLITAAERAVLRGQPPVVAAATWHHPGRRRHQTLISIADEGLHEGGGVSGFFSVLDDPAVFDGTIFHQERLDPGARSYWTPSISDNALLVLHAAGRVPVTAYLKPMQSPDAAAVLAAAASGFFANGTTDVKIEMTGLKTAEAERLMRRVALDVRRRRGQTLTAQFNVLEVDDIRTVVDLVVAGGFDRIALEGAAIMECLGGTRGLRQIVHTAHSRRLHTFVAGGIDADTIPDAVRSGVDAVGVISAVRTEGALDTSRIVALVRARNDAESLVESRAAAALADLDLRFSDVALDANELRVRHELASLLDTLDGLPDLATSRQLLRLLRALR